MGRDQIETIKTNVTIFLYFSKVLNTYLTRWSISSLQIDRVLLYYLTSEQLSEPTGSLKQLDIAVTAASIDTSSPCSIQQIKSYSFLRNCAQCNAITHKKNITTRDDETSPSLSNKTYSHTSQPDDSKSYVEHLDQPKLPH